MNGQIFVSYRREDSAGTTGRLFDRLARRFPRSRIFMDVDSIEPGEDFLKNIEQAVASCDVLIAVIGTRWLLSSDREGKSELDNPEDFVRLEIVTALKRGIRVIPVLVEGASMPSSRELPEELEPLRRRNAIELSHTRFNTDADRLAEAIDRALKQAKAQGELAQQTRNASASMERGETEQTPAKNAEVASRKIEAKQPSGKKGESSFEEQKRILLRSIFIAACLVIICISAIVFYFAHPRGAQVKPTPSPTLKRQPSPAESTALTPSIISPVASSTPQPPASPRENVIPQTVRTLEGHTGAVTAVAVTPDGRRAVSGSLDNTLLVWDLKSGETERALEGHGGVVRAVAVTRDGRRAVSGSGDSSLQVWDLESGQMVLTLKGHRREVDGVAVTPDGRHAVSASEDQTLRVWDLKSGKTVRTLKGHTAGVLAVAVTPDGRHAVSGSLDKTLRVWDLESGQTVRTLEGHTDVVEAVAVTPDGRRAVSGSLDNTLRVWDLESGQTVRTLEGHTRTVLTVAVTPDGRRAVSGSLDNTLRVWDLESGQTLRMLEGHTGWVNAVAVTPDGRHAVSGSSDDTLRVWDLESGG
jgi:WD40 repeat protein